MNDNHRDKLPPIEIPRNNKHTVNNVVVSKQSVMSSKSDFQSVVELPDLVFFNIRGRLFEIDKNCLEKKKSGNLSKESWLGTHFLPERECYYFNRNPVVFESLVDYLVTGKFHIPRYLCLDSVDEELEFWGFDKDEVLAECCWTRLKKEEEENAEQEEVHIKWTGAQDNEISTSTCKGKLWVFMEDMNSSKGAMAWMIFIVLNIIISVLCLTFESIPGCRVIPQNVSEVLSSGNITEEKVLYMLYNSEAHIAIYIFEIVANSILTVEFMLRLFACPSKCAFMKDVFNYMDFVSLIPVWLVIIMSSLRGSASSPGALAAFAWISSLRVLRVFRMLRLLKNFETMNTILMAMRKSYKEFLLLVTLIVIFCSIFASIIYYVEIYEDNFTTVPLGMWWALITMTTVGYGDYYPVTPFGYVVGVICAISGILVVAMPVPIIVNNFQAIYDYMKVSRQLRKRKANNSKQISSEKKTEIDKT